MWKMLLQITKISTGKHSEAKRAIPALLFLFISLLFKKNGTQYFLQFANCDHLDGTFKQSIAGLSYRSVTS